MFEKRKTIIVLEDSRKVGFGGGQKGSIEVINALHENFNCIATDSILDSIFAKESEKISKQKILRLYSIATKNMRKASFSIGILEFLTFPIFIMLNIFILQKYIYKNSLNKNNCILYAPLKKTLIYAYILNIINKIPFVYHARNFDNSKSIFYNILKKILQKAYIIICVSKSVQENLKLPNSILLYNSVSLHNPIEYCKNIENKNIVVAAFASLIEWKGLDYLMKSYKYLKNKEKVKIRIYGNGSKKNYLRTFEKENVELYDFCNNVNYVLEKEIDIVCVPSIEPEAFGRVPIEAAVFGIPAIVTNIGAQAEITQNEKTGIHVPIKNDSAIAKAIDFFIDNPDVYKQMSKNSLENVKQFDLIHFNEKINEIIGGI